MTKRYRNYSRFRRAEMAEAIFGDLFRYLLLLLAVWGILHFVGIHLTVGGVFAVPALLYVVAGILKSDGD